MPPPIRIVLIEDEYISRLFLSSQLQKMGYPVSASYPSGEEAVAAAERDRPELILADINLSGEMNGIAAVEKIREGHDAVVIFLTGYSDPAILAQTSAIKPLALLVKPLDIRLLRETITAAFPGKSA
jgi:CheY-like chemotaxis protein